MCYNCGCHIPQDDMGTPENITEKTLEKLAADKGKSPEETKLFLKKLLEENQIEKDPEVNKMFIEAAKAWGQSVEEAKKNVLFLLNSQT